MPYLKIQSNQQIGEPVADDLISAASRLVAEQLSKPERYVMVALEPPVPMMFAGSRDPQAYLELKSIGLPESKTAALSQALCQLIQDKLAIPPERTYIEFSDAPRTMWGWNNDTF